MAFPISVESLILGGNTMGLFGWEIAIGIVLQFQSNSAGSGLIKISILMFGKNREFQSRIAIPNSNSVVRMD